MEDDGQVGRAQPSCGNGTNGIKKKKKEKKKKKNKKKEKKKKGKNEGIKVGKR